MDGESLEPIEGSAVMLNLFQHPASSDLAGGKLDPETKVRVTNGQCNPRASSPEIRKASMAYPISLYIRNGSIVRCGSSLSVFYSPAAKGAFAIQGLRLIAVASMAAAVFIGGGAANARFLQVDPVGYKDQVNLYAYVENDPMNRSDPTGEYQRGDGFTEKEWEKFDDAQQAQASKMEQKATKLLGRAAAREAKGEAGAGRLRAAAANLQAGAAKLRDTSSRAPTANLLTQAEYAKLGRPEGSRAYTSPSNRNVTHFTRGPNGIMAPGPLSAGWIIGHDGLHTAGLNDQRGPNGELAYKGAYPENTKALMDIRGTDKAAINPDSLLDW